MGPGVILVVFLIVLMYVGTFALNKRYPEMQDLEQLEMQGCLNCPTGGSCSVGEHQKHKDLGEIDIYKIWKEEEKAA